ncbi:MULTISPECIES: hypothetical protein [Dickeya]|uniref:Uncharacterized protein n=1 Tax=Dickeya aquatica TaxID=1401087 RepID=A0A375A9I2_9GAMM|nr:MULTISPECIES: hypothetical protein [Dickeya]SLM62675.1 hypothetical protein DAQ1742_01735 [Dickeya aquatica]
MTIHFPWKDKSPNIAPGSKPTKVRKLHKDSEKKATLLLHTILAQRELTMRFDDWLWRKKLIGLLVVVVVIELILLLVPWDHG